MATLKERVSALAAQVGKDIKALNAITAKIGTLTELTTDEKSTLVAAINEIKSSLDDISSTVRSASEIDDTTPKTTKTYSSKKVSDLIKAITDILGDTALPTDTGYETVTKAVNKLKAEVVALKAKSVDLTELINDSEAGTDKVYSSSKIDEKIGEVNAGVDAKIKTKVDALETKLLNGAPAALDTLKELADALNNDTGFATKTVTALNNRVRFDEEQTLTAEQKTQACNNIGIGEPDTDFLKIYNDAKNG